MCLIRIFSLICLSEVSNDAGLAVLNGDLMIGFSNSPSMFVSHFRVSYFLYSYDY